MDGSAPSFQVTQVDNFTAVQDPEIARRVRGTFTVPCYLQPTCAPGGSFQLGSTGLPSRNTGNDWTANFDCIIPRTAVDGTPASARPAIYGHGLFGSASEVFNADIQQQLANTYGFVLCATDEIGMAGADLGNTAGILADVSNFPQLADRLQQGLLDEIFLGRLMGMTSGFSSDVAFHADGTTLGSNPVIDTSELYYQGSSQGGIMGGALTAVDPDFTRSVLNVPAMNYSVLLPRSVDYDSFAGILNRRLHRSAGAPAAALADPDALGPRRAGRLRAPDDDESPAGQSGPHGADEHRARRPPGHQLPVGCRGPDDRRLHTHPDPGSGALARQRHPLERPGDLRVPVQRLGGDLRRHRPVRANPSPPPTNIGVPPPPFTNTPNRTGEDPHGAPRGAPSALQLISDFLKPTGAVTNVCGPAPCYGGGYTGPGP